MVRAVVLPSVAACAVALPAGARGQVQAYDADGRAHIRELYRSMDEVAASGGWVVETVFEDQGLPVKVLRTRRKGPALWLLAGIHGEEPAPPNAAHRERAKLAALAKRGIPVVFFPLCNPVGYSKGWRYPDAREFSKENPGHSVGDVTGY